LPFFHRSSGHETERITDATEGQAEQQPVEADNSPKRKPGGNPTTFGFSAATPEF
jgi:hypothetical protein